MSFDPNKITFFARTDSRGKHVTFGIKAKDRQRHVYVIGKTGMGKSTLLENMAVQDIQNGEGMAFIDPHGSAAETLLNYIPEHRMKDVLYFAPADAAHPVSFNIMEDVGPDKRHLVVSGLMSVFKKIWVDAWSARMEYILQNTIMALLEYPDSTLLGVNRMLSDKKYRDTVVANVKDPGVKAFWVDEFAKYNERYMQEAGDAIKNKIGQFTGNPIIRNIIGQPKSSFDIRKMMDEKKIIIMNLSKGLIGESNANLLGSMLTTRIYLAAMSRAELSPEKMKTMPNFYFYVDEFQSFANATFANILSEARKYHLNLTIAHQYIEQMEEDVRNAVFGNVGTIIAFRVGPFDAEVLETIFTPQFLATDIVNLSFAQVYLTLMIDGIGSQPFSATTLPPIEPPVVSCKDMVIAASRQQFSRTRDEVELMIHKFHEPVEMPRHTGGGSNGGNGESLEGMRTPRRDEARPPRREERNGANGHTNGNGGNGTPTVGVGNGAVTTAPRPSAPAERPREHHPERRDERHNDRREGRDRRSNHEPHESVRREPERPEKKDVRLNDLRSVLQGIVKTDTGSAADKENPIQQAKVEKFEKARGELRDILSHTLAEVNASKPESVTARTEPEPEQKPVSHEAAAAVSEPTPTPAPTPVVSPEPSPVSAPAPAPVAAERVAPVSAPRAPEPVRQEITAKELERMMRVTTSDKPPL